jgi:indolepyruvate decarboxylase
MLSDITLGMFTAQIDQAKTIYATSEELSISYHNYENVQLKDFLQGLIDADIDRRVRTDIPSPKVPQNFSAVQGQKITVQRLFQRLNAFLTNKTVVIADVGDALYGGIDLVIHQGTDFLCPAYYASLGFSVPASIGAQLANPNLRPLVLVGDGAFQMTGMELSTVARFNLNPIVVVLNNFGYGTERALLDGPFNDLQQWHYSRIPEVIGTGKGFVIETEDQLDEALSEAQEYTKSFCIFDVRLDINDRSPALQRMTSRLAKRVV